MKREAGVSHAGWFGLLALFLSFLALAELPVPPLTARVTDLTHTLAPDQRQALEQKLAAFETQKGSQIAVLIVPTTQPEAIEQYAIRVAEQWKLGRKGVDDGVLLLVAKDDRALRIEVGYGLEGAIPDAVAKRIIEGIITPRFREGDFNAGLGAGVDALIKLVSGEPLPEPARGVSVQSVIDFIENAPPDVKLIMTMFFFLGVGRVLRAVLGRLLGASVAGGVAFFGAGLVLGSLIAALIIALLTFGFALVDQVQRGGGGFGSGGGGFSSGGGDSSGGGSDFSGGGGGFGGGGASGRW